MEKTKEQEILERGSKLPEEYKNKFDYLLMSMVEHEYSYDEILDKLEGFLNNLNK